MKKGLALFFALFIFTSAAEKYGVYDLQGNRISTFDAESNDLPSKIHQIKTDNSQKNLYISSLLKNKSSKPTSRYRYKIELGAYIEASKNETFSLCPDKEIREGTWISEYSISLNEDNCLSVQAPNLAGTFRILFLQNSGRMDTVQVLVGQSYIQMGDYSHQIWVPDSLPSVCFHNSITCETPAYGHYESIEYNQTLIVDKTPFTMGDAQYYSKIGNIEFSPFDLEEYPTNEKLEESKLPYLTRNYASWRFANERSKKEGLDIAYHIVDKNSFDNKNGNFIIIDSNNRDFLVRDTLASGYRLPIGNEWLFLMRAGAPTRYYWGDEEDSLTVSRYAWVRPVGMKPVAKLLPNRFGLYDMVGLTNYEMVEIHGSKIYPHLHKKSEDWKNLDFSRNYYLLGSSCSYYDIRALSPECDFIRRIGAIRLYRERPTFNITCIIEPDGDGSEKCVRSDEPVLKSRSAGYEGLRLLRKTPKLHKLEKF